MLIMIASFGTVITLLVLIGFKEKAINIDEVSERNEITLKEELKHLSANRNYKFATLSLSLTFMFIWTFSTVVGQLISPFGMDNTEFASKLGFLFNGVGIIGSIFFCLIIMRLQVTIQTEIILKNACIIAITLSLISFVLFTQSVINKNAQQTAIFTSLIGFFSMPVMFISYELLVSLTPTIGEAMSCGVLNSIANITCFAIVTALTPVLSQ